MRFNRWTTWFVVLALLAAAAGGARWLTQQVGIHFRMSAAEVARHALERAGLPAIARLPLIRTAPRYAQHTLDGTVRSTHPRILLPELSSWNGRGIPPVFSARMREYARRHIEPLTACAGGDGLSPLAACWLAEGSAEARAALIRRLPTAEITYTASADDVGNGWDLALAYDLARLHPQMTPALAAATEHTLAVFVSDALAQLDRGDLSLWHTRAALAFATWISAVVLDPARPDYAELIRRAQAYYLDAMEATALTEAWPEGYNYWINNRGFLFALAGAAYLNGLHDAANAERIRHTLQRVGLWHIYATRPDNRVEGLGDEGPRTDLKDETRRVIDLLAQLTRDPSLDSYSRYLASLYGAESYYGSYLWGFKLFNDPTVSQFDGATLADAGIGLPYSALFGRGAFNQAYIRSGWHADDTFISFRAGHTFTHHGHYDAGHFTLFKGKPLAVNSGTYGDFFSAHRLNYTIRTIAKNSLLIMRPHEQVPIRASNFANVADGGQRVVLPTGSAIESVADFDANLARGYHLEGGSVDTYSYVPGRYTFIRANLTAAYNTPTHDEGGRGGKASAVYRTLFYSYPEDCLYIHDTLTVTDAAFPAKWLLHTIAKPHTVAAEVVAGTSDNGILRTADKHLEVINADWQLSVERILPENATTRLIGGNDYRYYVETDGDGAVADGRNMGAGAEDKPWFDQAMWRIEIEAAAPTLHPAFLLVLTPHRATAVPTPVQALKDKTGNVIGVQSATHALVFVAAASTDYGFDNLAPQLTRVTVVCESAVHARLPVRGRDVSICAERGVEEIELATPAPALHAVE